MKKVISLGLITLLSVSLLGACSSKKSEKNETISPSEVKEKLKGKVKIPITAFKTQEMVKAEFEAAGLKPKFVVSNFDDKAKANNHYLRKGECDSIGEQPERQFFNDDEVGNKFGFYADKGATLIVGYSDHDFDGTKNKTEDTSNKKEASSSDSTSKEIKTTKTENSTSKSSSVSDESIKSIQTYEDYLTMYKAIIDNYLYNYENIVKDTVLYNKETFEEQKKQNNEAFEEQKKQYGEYGNKKLIGKDTLVDFLINYRNSLDDYTNKLKESLN